VVEALQSLYIWLLWGGGILGIVLGFAAALTRRLSVGRSILLTFALFDLGAGLALLGAGVRTCALQLTRTATGSGETVCVQWSASPGIALVGGLIALGAVVGIVTIVRKYISRKSNGWMFLLAAALAFAALAVANSAMGLLMLLPPLLFLVFSLRSLSMAYKKRR
jgi:hypothetical protein